MSMVSNIAKNTGILIVGNIIFKIISFIVTIYLAKYLGKELFGVYNFVFAYIAFFNIASDLGLQFILVREMSQKEKAADKIIGNAYIIRLFLTTLSVILSLSIASLTNYPLLTKHYMYVASLTIIFISFSDFYSTIFQSNLKMQYNIYSKLAYRVLSAFLILWIIHTEKSLIYIMYSLVVSEILKTFLSYRFSRKLLKPRFEFDINLCKYILMQSLPLAISSSIQIIHNKVDMIMLSLIKTNMDIGIYAAAFRLSEPILFIPFALTTTIFPIMSASIKKSKEKLIRTYLLNMKYLLIIMLPIVIIVSSTATEIINLIFGSEFIEAAVPLSIIIWSLIFISLNSVLSNMLIAGGYQKMFAYSTFTSAIINIIINMLFIPIWSYNGASVATVISNGAFFLMAFYYVSKHLCTLPINEMIKPLLCGCALIIILNIFPFTKIILILFGILVYIFALIMTKSVTKDDLELINKIRI